MSKEKLRAAIRRRRQQKNSGDGINVREFLQGAAAEEAEMLFDEIREHILSMADAELKELLSKVKKGDPGKDGRNGRDGKNGKNGKDGKNGRDGKDGRGIKGDKGDTGKDGRDISKKDLLTKINDIDNGIKIKTISGLDALLKNLQRAIREKVRSTGGHKHGGGGMTIDAGSNITLVRNSNGRWTISASASGGSNIKTEVVTATQNGDHVEIDLAQLSETYTSVMFVSRTGQLLMPNGDASLPGSSWSQAGDIITVYNAGTGDGFLVQYLYA